MTANALPLPMTTSAQGLKPPRRPAQFSKFFGYLHRFEPLAAAALGIRDIITTDGDSDFLIQKQTVLAFDANGVRRGDKVRFEVSPLQEGFMSAPTFLSAFGSGRFPWVMAPVPIRLPRRGQFVCIADSRNVAQHAGGTTIYIAHLGAKVYQAPILPAHGYQLAKDFWALMDLTAQGDGTIPANSTRTVTYVTDDTSDYEIRKLAIVADAAITINFQTVNDNWFARPLRGELLGASLIETTPATVPMFSGELPFILPAPRIIMGGNYLSVTVNNLDTVNAIRCQVVMWGERLYPAAPPLI